MHADGGDEQNVSGVTAAFHPPLFIGPVARSGRTQWAFRLDSPGPESSDHQEENYNRYDNN